MMRTLFAFIGALVVSILISIAFMLIFPWVGLVIKYGGDLFANYISWVLSL